MILRRFSEHIRKQNWFAVALDLMVVVVGIYIGLQADAWMSERQDRVLEVEYLERLLADMEDSIVAQREQLDAYDDSIVAIDYIAAAQRAGSFDGIDESRIIQGINSVNWVAPPATNMVTIRELQSTGNIGLIRDVSIRTAIGEFERSFSALEFDASQVSNLMATGARETMTWAFMEPNALGEHRSVTEFEDPEFGIVQHFDGGRMLQNPDAARITSWISGWARYQGAVMAQHHKDTIEFRDLLKKKLDSH